MLSVTWSVSAVGDAADGRVGDRCTDVTKRQCGWGANWRPDQKPEPAVDVALMTTLPVGPVKVIGLPEQVGVAGGRESSLPTRTA